MMYKLICLTAVAAILYSCSSAQVGSMTATDNTLTAKEKSSGWQLLFDGKTMDKWHTYGGSSLQPGWKIQENAVYLDTTATGRNANGKRTSNNIVTNEDYGNFDLKLDWKISPKGNSGLIFYVHEDSSLYHETYNTGMEMQVLDNGTPTRLGHPDGKLYSHRAGDLYDLIASKEANHPQGEWNHVEVISLNGKLDFYMNGQHTLSTTMWNDNWRQMIAVSKFKDMKNFGTFKQGKISLQDHGDIAWFKNIKIKKL